MNELRQLIEESDAETAKKALIFFTIYVGHFKEMNGATMYGVPFSVIESVIVNELESVMPMRPEVSE